MNERGKSDGRVVPEKPANGAGRAAEERVEGRGPAKGNSLEDSVVRTQSRGAASTGLERVRQAAGRDRKQKFTALLHHAYDLERLRRAYRAINPKAAKGVDGETWKSYGEKLEENLQDLSGRLKREAYRGSPTRGIEITKADGRKRPLGIPTVEDKIVQRAVTEVLNAIYEEDFLDFSHGFRPGRDPHKALDALATGLHKKRVNWVLDADIRSFFDTLDHECLIQFVEHRVGDQRIVRLIWKWLSAGVLKDGEWRRSEKGTVQGGSISPLLANVYLHYVFDLWANRWGKTRAKGDVMIVRYADDFIVGFEHRSEAEQFLAELKERLLKFKLELHPEKTRLIEFGRFADHGRGGGGGRGRPGTFDFLGFTHICGKTRDGKFMAVRHTMRKRMAAKLKEVKAVLRQRHNHSIPELGAYLKAVVQGHYNYYAVPLNLHAVSSFRWKVGRLWQRALSRRSQKANVTWERMSRYIARWLPPAQICRSWPFPRLGVAT